MALMAHFWFWLFNNEALDYGEEIGAQSKR